MKEIAAKWMFLALLKKSMCYDAPATWMNTPQA